MGPMPTSIVASYSSGAISVNCLQPGVQCCSDCGSVNKSQTSCAGAGNMKCPSIFIDRFHRHRILPECLASHERTLALLSCTLFGYVKCPVVSNIFLAYRNHDVLVMRIPSVSRQFIDFGALAYGAERGSPLLEARGVGLYSRRCSSGRLMPARGFPGL
jgi:hypothetical protein